MSHLSLDSRPGWRLARHRRVVRWHPTFAEPPPLLPQLLQGSRCLGSPGDVDVSPWIHVICEARLSVYLVKYLSPYDTDCSHRNIPSVTELCPVPLGRRAGTHPLLEPPQHTSMSIHTGPLCFEVVSRYHCFLLFRKCSAAMRKDVTGSRTSFVKRFEMRRTAENPTFLICFAGAECIIHTTPFSKVEMPQLDLQRLDPAMVTGSQNPS